MTFTKQPKATTAASHDRQSQAIVADAQVSFQKFFQPDQPLFPDQLKQCIFPTVLLW